MLPQLDVFSFQIVAKYFYFYEDYVNAVQINKKFIKILDRFRYNPISVSTLKLFPYIETQHSYTEKDTLIPFVKRYVVWFTVSLTDSYFPYTDLEVVYKHVKIDNENFFTDAISDINEIPKSVNIYSLSLLNNFTEITEFSVPLHITKLKTSVFDNNTNLVSVNLHNNIRKIPTRCFFNCGNLKQIDLSPTLTKIGDSAFSQCGIESLEIPDSVSYLGESTFQNCTVLKHLTFSKSLFIIPNGCCDGCHVLSDVVLPENLLETSSRAFQQNYNLDVDIPKSVTKIEQDAFYECLGNIYLDQNVKKRKTLLWILTYFLGCMTITKNVTTLYLQRIYTLKSIQLLSKKISTLKSLILEI
ncbi:hypothetical protein EIN_157180 [Entamoeba invadens IP1]|uniref:Leucine rich repeat containing protein BspA family protein n=1 Tax=Entamoeba invadens IP1 TaxID=370355 RepID=L7FK01_ENTIV|nr:hypothetical protein EIN_157180 [Entamoeba invadens IP1]ELP84048.1 hypothetical protein EIN_157180 [Entamoeba invadens IP1]|eukprot:XP_004183394.1 hypothetical protein EIN_157180 [Entamoeba invadens IP1]